MCIYIYIYNLHIYVYIYYIHTKKEREQFVLDNFARGIHHWDMPAIAHRMRTHILYTHMRHGIFLRPCHNRKKILYTNVQSSAILFQRHLFPAHCTFDLNQKHNRKQRYVSGTRANHLLFFCIAWYLLEMTHAKNIYIVLKKKWARLIVAYAAFNNIPTPFESGIKNTFLLLVNGLSKIYKALLPIHRQQDASKAYKGKT